MVNNFFVYTVAMVFLLNHVHGMEADPLPAGIHNIQNIQAAWEESDDNIVKVFQTKGHLTGNILKKEAIKPSRGKSSKAFRILFVTAQEPGKSPLSYAIKICQRERGQQEYNDEKALITNNTIIDLKKIINDYAKNKNVKLPVLTDYYATEEKEDFLLTLMEKAQGESLGDIVDALFNENLLFEPEYPKNIRFSEEQIAETGKEIGEQVGRFVRAFFEKKKTFPLLGDIRDENFLYDEKNKQLYFIDLGRTQEIPYPKLREFTTYEDSEEAFITYLWRSFFPFQKTGQLTDIWNKKEEKKTSLVELFKTRGLKMLKGHRLGILASEAFLKAYVDQVKDLEPAKNKGPNYFLSAIEYCKKSYITKIEESFGKNTPDTTLVKRYLFAPLGDPMIEKLESTDKTKFSDMIKDIFPNKEKSTPQEKNNIPSLSQAGDNKPQDIVEKYVTLMQNKMKDTRNLLDELLIDATKYKINKWNFYSIDDFRRYYTNLDILKDDKKIVIDVIAKYVEKIIDLYKTELEQDLKAQGINQHALNQVLRDVKINLATTVHSNLITKYEIECSRGPRR